MNPVGREIQQSHLLHLLDLLRNHLKTVFIEIQDLDLFSRRSLSQSLDTLQCLLGTPLGIVGKVERHQFRHPGQSHRELCHLRTVINLNVCA